ncbi:hypothetical protein D3C73_1638560 [compost metagenome]
MLTMLLKGTGFGFLPRSVAQPYLDKQELVELPCECQAPVTSYYAHCLTEKREDIRVKLGLQLLGVPLDVV